MTRHGVAFCPEEWWRFDFDGWSEYPIGNRLFEQFREAEET